jgi:ATP-dependent Clp protease ATP-binding subunit ClpA
VEIFGKAIETVIELAAQPEIARALPAGALELLDRACSAARLDDAEPQNGAGRRQVTVEHVARAFEDTFSGDNIRGGTDQEAYA